MKRNHRAAAALLLFTAAGLSALLAQACFVHATGSPSPPDWVDGSGKKYPAALYLTGVGHADSRPAAEDRAYAAISKIFAAEIRSRTEEWEKYLQSDAEGRTADSRQIRIENATEVSTRKLLENVTIAETWNDEARGVTYVLAVMDREHAASSLRDRIASLDLTVAGLLKQAQQGDPKLQTVRALHSAVENLLLREAYNTELRVLDTAGKGEESGVRLEAVHRDLREFLAAHFKISVEVTGENNEAVRSALVEGLNRQGLPVVSADPAASGLRPDLRVKGAVTFEPVRLPESGPKRTFFVRWSAAFDLTDESSRQVIGSVSRQGREGHLTQPEAEARALRMANREVTDEVGRRIAEFIYGEEKK